MVLIDSRWGGGKKGGGGWGGGGGGQVGGGGGSGGNFGLIAARAVLTQSLRARCRMADAIHAIHWENRGGLPRRG